MSRNQFALTAKVGSPTWEHCARPHPGSAPLISRGLRKFPAPPQKFFRSTSTPQSSSPAPRPMNAARPSTHNQSHPNQLAIDRSPIDPDRLQPLHHQAQSTSDRFLKTRTEHVSFSTKPTPEPLPSSLTNSLPQVPAFTIFTAGFYQFNHASKPVIRVPSLPDPRPWNGKTLQAVRGWPGSTRQRSVSRRATACHTAYLLIDGKQAIKFARAIR
jgi:hypothetical protein